MRMVTIVCRQPDVATALEQLRALGVMHLLPHRLRPSSEVDNLQKRRDQVATALALLPAETPSPASATDVEAVVAELHRLGTERRELEQQQADLAAERLPLEPFGDFDPDAARQLADHGVVLKLYLLTGKGEVPAPPAGCALEIVGKTPSSIAAVLVGPPSSVLTSTTLAVREVPLPARSLAAIDCELADCAQRAPRLVARLAELAAHRPALDSHLNALDEEIELLQARAGMNEEPDLAWLSGACPTDGVPQVEAAAAQHGWALLVREPGPGDLVPTLLRSPRWVKQIHSVLQMLGITPGYGEPDSSALFLVFLVLFAAMLIGDAGYGTLLLIATYVLAHGRPVSQPLRLLRTIAFATIGWGAITGTWLAIPTTDLPWYLSGIRNDWLTGPDLPAASKHVMLLCFFLGALHLTLAHAWSALRSIRSFVALAQLGWIACTWFMFAIARHMVLGDELPSVMWTVLMVGVALIVLFMTPVAKLKDEWFNHVMLPLGLVSNFVDVVSYLRLFAVGTAGVAVATSFNAMATKAAADGGFGYVVAALIAIFGHSLNLALCAMGVLVHGVRLNTLEFSAHLGLQWNGVSYRPFARREALLAQPESTKTPISEA